MRRGENRTTKTTLWSERSSALKKDLTGPTLLEMSGYAPTRPGGLTFRLPVPARGPWSSQRFQELDDGILVGAFQFLKLLGDMAGLAAVSRDRVEKC
jgi:hypothetical protein